MNQFFYAIKLKMFRLVFHEARLFFLLPVFMLMYNTSYAQLQRALTVEVKFKIEEGDLKDSYLVIAKKDGSSQTLPGSSRFKVDLDFNSTYILSFNKPGYVTKKIELNTTMDDERRSQGVHLVDFVVVLFKQYDGVNIVVFNQPVGKFQYSKKMDDFDFDTDYTKSIRSAIEDAEKELKKKQEEEKRNPKPPAKDTTLAIATKPVIEEKKKEQLAENKKPAEEPKKPMEKQMSDDTPPISINDKTKERNEGNDGKKKAKQDGGEDAENNIEPRQGSDEKNELNAKQGEEENNRLGTGVGSDSKKSETAKGGDEKETSNASSSSQDKSKGMGTKSGDDKTTELKDKDGVSEQHKKPDEGNGTDPVNPVANRNKGKDNLLTKSNVQAGSDNYEEPKKEVVKEKDEPSFTPAPTIDIKVDREEINEDKRTILNVWVTKGNKTIMYTRIKYSWGGVFYFKDMKTSISEHYFNQAIAGK